MAFRFGDFELSPETRILTGHGRAVALTPKAFDLLELLVRRRPVVVSKDQIRNALWPDTFVVEANVANLVREIRAALADSARHPRYIRTAPGHGYAFDHAVVEFGVVPAVPRAQALRLIGEGHVLQLEEGEHVVGRGRGSDLVIRDRTVSRRHAKVTVRGTTVAIEDLGSLNGTFLDGRRLSAPAALADGEEVRLGAVSLRLQVTTAANTVSVPQLLAES